MNHQIFISSYLRDFEWFTHCLISIKRFAVGFLPPVVCVSSQDYHQFQRIVHEHFPDARVVVKDGRPNQGFMRAQLAMMTADLLCPSADVLYWLGSDCLITDTFTPDKYNHEGKPIVLYRPYAKLDPLIWRKGTSRVLGFNVEVETMGRLPSAYPREIFEPMRRHVEVIHKKPFEDYIYDGDIGHRDTSEANILGAFAHRYMPDSCEWIDATITPPPATLGGWAFPVAQFFSHGGLDRPMECCAVLPDGTNTVGRTPRSVIQQILYS